MARASTPTKLPLDRWFKTFGVNPLHANQCFLQDFENSTGCQATWFQYDYQDDERVSREQLAQAILQAEINIEAFLGYHLIPAWDVEERHVLERVNHAEFFNLLATDVRGMRSIVQPDWGHVLSGGIEKRVLSDTEAVIVWSTGARGLTNDVGTVTITDHGWPLDEYELYYPDQNGAEGYRIRPISATIVGGNVVFTFFRELTVLASLQEDLQDPRGVDFSVTGNFLDEVDVYHHYNDPSTQATLMWEQLPMNCAVCSGTGCVTCANVVQTACLTPRNYRLGEMAFTPATWNTDTLAFDFVPFVMPSGPEMVQLYYRSGWRNKMLAQPNVEMDADLAYCVAIYAASMLDRKVCDCKGLNDGIARWQVDLAAGTNEVRQLMPGGTLKALDCPLGTKAGAVAAWQRLGRGSAVTAPIGKAVLV